MTVKASHCDNRGTRETPYGFVYFRDGEHRVVYAKGLGEFNGVSLGTGGWPPVTMEYVQEAQRFLEAEYGPEWYKE